MRTEFLSVPVDLVAPEEIMKLVDQALFLKNKIRIEGVNVSKLIDARRDKELLSALDDAELVHVDGAGIILGARLIDFHFPERIAGIDLMLNLISHLENSDVSFFFLGAQEDVLNNAINRVRQEYPNLKIGGHRNGYFSEEEEMSVVKEINNSKSQILFVGISSPKKEMFIKKYWNILNVNIAMGVGGSFDVLGGSVDRAPLWMQKMGLEWFFRFIQEPKRLWRRYLISNSTFVCLLVAECLRSLGVRLGKYLF